MTRDAALQWIIGWTFRRDVALSAEARDDLLAVLMLPALTARSEGFREGAFEEVIAGLELDLDYHRKFGFQQTVERLHKAITLLRALSPRETDASVVRREGHKALRARDGKLETFDPHPSASAPPPGEVDEMVEEIRYFVRSVGNRVPSQVQLEQWAALISKVGQTQNSAINWTTDGCPKHHGQSWIMSVPVVYTEIGKRCPICNPPPPERP